MYMKSIESIRMTMMKLAIKSICLGALMAVLMFTAAFAFPSVSVAQGLVEYAITTGETTQQNERVPDTTRAAQQPQSLQTEDFQFSARGDSTKPYCTATSNQGDGWWTWTVDSQDQACFIAFTKVLGSGQSVDRATWGYYKTNALNQAQLSCKQGNKEVSGTGVKIFENAGNLGKSLNWSSCTVKIINKPSNQPEPNPELPPVCDKKPDLPQCN